MSKNRDNLLSALDCINKNCDSLYKICAAFNILGLDGPKIKLKYCVNQIQDAADAIREAEIEIVNERFDDSQKMTKAVFDAILTGHELQKRLE